MLADIIPSSLLFCLLYCHLHYITLGMRQNTKSKRSLREGSGWNSIRARKNWRFVTSSIFHIICNMDINWQYISIYGYFGRHCPQSFHARILIVNRLPVKGSKKIMFAAHNYLLYEKQWKTHKILLKEFEISVLPKHNSAINKNNCTCRCSFSCQAIGRGYDA